MLTYKKILVPVDFTLISETAIVKAANHSEASNSQLLVAHVVDDAHSAPSVTSDATNEADAKLTSLLDALEIGYCEKLVSTGDTVATLLQIINDQGVDLVVMGTHKGTPVSPLIRSMTVEVVTQTECDILVLHK